jgi:Transposase, Mutator family
VKVGRDLISRVTDAVLDDVREWQQRPLDDVYPVIFLDALVLKIREGGTVQRRACYLALGVTVEGERDVLGIWLLGGRGRQVLDAGAERAQAARRPGHPDLLFDALRSSGRPRPSIEIVGCMSSLQGGFRGGARAAARELGFRPRGSSLGVLGTARSWPENQPCSLGRCRVS